MGPLSSALGLICPPRCAACAAPCGAAETLCGACRRRLGRSAPIAVPPPPGIDAALAAGPYEGVHADLVHALKFARRLPAAGAAAEAMVAAAGRAAGGREVVPAPADPLRRRRRGFDPAEELAMAVARLSGSPLRRCLRRRPGRRQVGRDRTDRLRDPPRVRARAAVPARALLVDDVITTGATASACAAALREGGCRSVVVLALAHVAGAPGGRPDRAAAPG